MASVLVAGRGPRPKRRRTAPFLACGLHPTNGAGIPVIAFGLARSARVGQPVTGATLLVGRLAPGLNEMTWHRVDAHPAWRGTRDVGAGTDVA